MYAEVFTTTTPDGITGEIRLSKVKGADAIAVATTLCQWRYEEVCLGDVACMVDILIDAIHGRGEHKDRSEALLCVTMRDASGETQQFYA